MTCKTKKSFLEVVGWVVWGLVTIKQAYSMANEPCCCLLSSFIKNLLIETQRVCCNANYGLKRWVCQYFIFSESKWKWVRIIANVISVTSVLQNHYATLALQLNKERESQESRVLFVTCSNQAIGNSTKIEESCFFMWICNISYESKIQIKLCNKLVKSFQTKNNWK